MFILPAVFLCIGAALPELEQHFRQSKWYAIPLPSRSRGVALGSLIGLFVFANVTVFFDIPRVVYAVTEEEQGIVQNVAGTLHDSQPSFQIGAGEESRSLAAGARQYDLTRNDAYWQQLITLIHRHHSDTTAILSLPHTMGSFRHLTYYLDEYRVYSVGKDQQGTFGHLFTAEDRTSDYSVDGLQTARKRLMLRADVRTVIIPDQAIYERLDKEIPRYPLMLDEGELVFIALVPAGTTLTFVEAEDGNTTITLSQQRQYPHL